jgi:hypothetical protein
MNLTLLEQEQIRLAIKQKLQLYSTEKDNRMYAYAKRIDYYNGLIKPVVNFGHEEISSRMCAAIADKISAYSGTNAFDINLTARDITNEAEMALAQTAEDIEKEILEASDKDLWFMNCNETADRLGDGLVTTEMRDGMPYHENIEKPENVYFGWRTDNANELEWWAYEYGITPEAALDRFKERLTPSSDIDGLALNTATGKNTLAGIYDLVMSTLTQRQDTTPKFVKITIFNTFIDLKDQSGKIIVPAGSQVVCANGTPYETHKGKAKDLYHFKAFTSPGLPTGVCAFETSANLVVHMDKKLGEQSDASAQAVNPKFVTTDSNIERMKQKLIPNRSQIIKKQDKETVLELLKMDTNAYSPEPLLKNILNFIRTNSGLQELGQDQISPNISGRALAYVYQGIIQIVSKKRIRWSKILKDMVVNDLYMFTEDKPEMRKAFFDGKNFKFKVNIIWPEVLENDRATKIANVLNLTNSKIISKHTAMTQVDIADPTMEQKRIDLETAKELEYQQALQQELQQPSEATGPIMNESMNQEGEGIASTPNNAGSAQTAGMGPQSSINQQNQNGV